MNKNLALLLSLLLTCFCRAEAPAPAPTTSPSTQPAPPVRVELPDGWHTRISKAKNIIQAGEYPDLKAHFILSVQPIADFDVDLAGWAKQTVEATRRTSTLQQRSETALKESQLAGQHVFDYDVFEGTTNTHGRIFMLQVGDYFCKLTCWTNIENWQAAEPKFEELVGHFQTR